MIPQKETERYLQGWLDQLAVDRMFWHEFRSAFEGKFWREANMWTRRGTLQASVLHGGAADPLPIKVEVNLLRPYVKSLLALLFYRRARVIAEPPAVWGNRPGRTSELPPRSAEMVQAFADDWLNRRDFKAHALHAFNLVLMYGRGAFKTGADRPVPGDQRDVTDRIWVEVIPPWGCFWDERAVTRRNARYIGHWRQESTDTINDMFGKKATKGLKTGALADYLASGLEEKDGIERDESYLWLLEFYDNSAQKVVYYVGEGATNDSTGLRLVDTSDFSYDRPTIQPIVVDPRPEHPLVGLSAVDGLYQKNAERNLLMTIVANAMRRDAARKRMIRAGALNPTEMSTLNDPFDSSWVEVESEEAWERLIHNVKEPDLAQSIAKYGDLLELATQAEKGTSDITQGRQGRYLSATEAGLLSQYSESTTGLMASGMDDATSACMEDVLMITAAELKVEGRASLKVRLDGGVETLPRKVLALPWRLTAVDTASTPIRQAQARSEWQQAQPLFLELLGAAAGGPPVQGADGQVDMSTSSIRPEVKRGAQEALDYMVQQYRLPRTMTWAALAQSVAERDQAEENREPDTAREEEIRQLTSKLGTAPQLTALPGGTP